MVEIEETNQMAKKYKDAMPINEKMFRNAWTRNESTIVGYFITSLSRYE